jgi:hypothetical protein
MSFVPSHSSSSSTHHYPSFERHPSGALLPEFYPGEDSEGRMTLADLQRARRWGSEPSSGDFQRQCDALGVNRWHQDFLADEHNDRLDRIARRSGLLDAPNIIAEHARAAAAALAVAAAQLRQGEYNQATQQHVHAAFAAYAAAAEAYNPERTSRLNALHAFHSTPPAQRGASWRGAASML